MCPCSYVIDSVLVFYPGSGTASTCRKLTLVALHILVVHLTSYLMEEKDMSEGVPSTAVLDVAEFLTAPAKGPAGQVISSLTLMLVDSVGLIYALWSC